MRLHKTVPEQSIYHRYHFLMFYDINLLYNVDNMKYINNNNNIDDIEQYVTKI